jgi:hypothetical protein
MYVALNSGFCTLLERDQPSCSPANDTNGQQRPFGHDEGGLTSLVIPALLVSTTVANNVKQLIEKLCHIRVGK